MVPIEFLTTEESEKLRQFMEITNIADHDSAYDLLNGTHWNLEQAIESFFVLGSENSGAAVGYEGYQLDPVEQSISFSAGGDTHDSYDNNEPGYNIIEEEGESSEDQIVEPLISPLAQSETEAVLSFTDNFEQRYCSDTNAEMPSFFTGTLQRAVETAFSPENGKPLLLFVNNEHSTHTKTFIQEGLCNDFICDLIRNNFVMFPWDVTERSNMDKLLQMLLDSNMRPVHEYLTEFSLTERHNYPLMMVINRKRNSFEILGTINGRSDLNDMCNILHESFQQFKHDAIAQREEENRIRRDRELLDEQRAEYERSLAADLKKRREKEEQEKQEEESRKEMIRKKEEEDNRVRKAELRLPLEPKHSGPGTINIKFRLPEDLQETRLFYKKDKIQSLLDFLESKRYFREHFNYLNSDFPKKEITKAYDPKKTFEEVNWPSKETVFVNNII